ncbi:hypothetical protein CLU96_4454 [Chryseobacterium sp. 52]|uniref:hypothetical protein n=1 Tax=Chryseobacterium sp. 52 TaxID=2035213 RepID=UPI000C1A1D1B|nr:hypothetical protein [Chryseobacterium sp. 52]PIF47402.1 hypothetical protein CLU96_4454 [Chryseobacterium sp. 52]
MKTKIVLLLFFSLVLCSKLTAQYSLTNMNEIVSKNDSIRLKSDDFYPQTLSKEGKEGIENIAKKEIKSKTGADLNVIIKQIDLAKDFREVKNLINKADLTEDEKGNLTASVTHFELVAGLKKGGKGDRSVRALFPAGFNKWGSRLSTVFFEGSPEYTQLFQNNNVVYNPNLRNLSFNSEVVNDYLGPLRIGIGFQFNSTVKDNDSIAAAEVKKDQLVSSLQNGGGNLFVNLKFPVIAVGENGAAFGLKSFIYHNTGIELTKINESDNEFIMTNNTGITVGAFAVGHKKQISAFFEATGAILYGNSKFNKILSVDQDFRKILPLFNLGVGISFLQMYTVKAEFYPAGSYIKRNFPATISFIIVPKTK